MMFTGLKLVAFFVQTLCVLYCGGNEHFRDQNQEEFTKRLSDFEIVTPALVSRNGTFLSFDLLSSSNKGELYILFTAFGRDFLLHIRKHEGLVSSQFSKEILPRGFDVSSQTTDCFYTGELAGGKSSVALSNCRGLIGIIRTETEELFLEPMKNLGRFPHLLYKRTSLLSRNGDSQTSGSCGAAKALTVNPALSAPRRRPTRSVVTDITVQLLVAVDREMIDFHGNESVEEYVLSIMNMVAELYRDPSVGTVINIEIVKLMLLFETPKGLSITHHGDRTLQSFCDWQAWLSRDTSSENPRYDAAVLLTRKDICADQNAPCATVGMAYLHGMCDPKRRCSIAEDDGLDVAFAIAHELGHNLGIHHDGEGNFCVDFSGPFPNVMSPQWLKRNRHGTMKWSECSRDYLNSFLRSRASKCLRTSSNSSTVELASQLQGVVFSADDQCRHTYGNRAQHCTKYKNRVCYQLWCSIEGETLCRTRLLPAAKGSACGPGKWCMYGHCVDNTSIPTRRDGAWGEWSGWSSCSRSCGVGINTMTRLCNKPSPKYAGRYCIGEQKRFKTCNVKPCPKDSKDFRHVQCDSFNKTRYRGETFAWTPVTSEVQPCALFCKPKDSQRRFSAKLAAKAIDGTPCRAGYNDICIDGKCVQVGCDNLIGSTAEEDTCGVCKGNGSTCTVVEGRFNQLAGSGYVEVALIPKGATNVAITEVKPCASFLALKSDLGTYYINGNWKIDLPGNFNANGTIVYYLRKGTWEKIVARGPTSAPLHIMVLYHGFNLGVKYRYSVPLNRTDGRKDGDGLNNHGPTYAWFSRGWTPCSAHCGGGITKRLNVRCARFYQGNLSYVVSKYCNRATRPRPDTRACNSHKCRVWWAVSEWLPCSRTCGAGLQYRLVQCRKQLPNGSDLQIPSRTCPRDKRPSVVRHCIKRACYMQWITGTRSKCFAICGVGYYVRDVRCPITGKCAPWTKPPTRKLCHAQPCEHWTTGDWGKCRSARCGFGIQRRRVTCVHRLTGKKSSICSKNNKPVEEKRCRHTKCDGQSYLALTNLCSASKSTVTALDLKPSYEKGQSRRKSSSEQRLLDAEVHLEVLLSKPLQSLNVFVERCPEAARLLSDTTGRVALTAIWDKRQTDQLHFSVDLDSVYVTREGKKVYELSRVKGEERNLFRLVVILLYNDGTSEDFFLKPFQVKSKKKPDFRSPEDFDERSDGSLDAGYCGTPDSNRKRKREDDVGFDASPTGSCALRQSFEEVHTNYLEARTAIIDDLRLTKPMLTQRGDIAYHFKLKKHEGDATLEEGDVIGFFEEKDGKSHIEKLTHFNAKRARLAGVISRSAYLEAKAPTEEVDKGTDDIVCVIGMVDVKTLGPVQNGERIYASLEHPGVAVPESRVNSSVSTEAFLLGQSVEHVEVEPASLSLARCFVSVLLSISSGHVMQTVKELREDVKEDVKSEVKHIKRKCLSGLRRWAIVGFILAVLLGVLLYQLFAPGTALRYWRCNQGSIKGHEMYFTFETSDKQWPRVHGIEFTFDKLKKKLDLKFDAMTNITDAHYYLNVDRCAHGGLRPVASTLDGMPMVRGAEIVGVDDNCTTVYYYSKGWYPYKTARDIYCSSHPTSKG